MIEQIITRDPSSKIFSLQNGINEGFPASNSHLVYEWQKHARWNELKPIVKERV